ncbi:MAG: asparagine synthase (glutamine-hydrolyzing) [Methylobacter sp.]|nr:asparagine synthase (glutamine-hydrolyzing) [Methylobacter sp.]
MCGISGYLLTQSTTKSSQIIQMSTAIKHRGPDDEGFLLADVSNNRAHTFSSARSPSIIQEHWPVLKNEAEAPLHQLAMAQVRYSIIDLSPAGHQPMWSTCGNYCLTFNGEIYNYIELREKLEQLGIAFRTSSDTEVLLNGYIVWGEGVFELLNGFFAVAIYDIKRKAVLLGRDRLGKALLYLSSRPNEYIYWASEIKALLAAGCVNNNSIDTASVSDFILFGRRDRGGTFWRDVQDFPPGHFAWIDQSCVFKPVRYWALPTSRLSINDISANQASTGLADILADALNIRLRADVPIGFELSGGMDSSALVGLAAGRLQRSFKTYTIEFTEKHSNEEPFARAVAQRYPNQIDYKVIKPPKEEFWQGANDFIWLQEEPFHAPNLHTSQNMQRLIKADGAHVVISGAAGDEMLAGYAGDYQGPFLRHLLASGNVMGFASELFANTEINPMPAIKGMAFDLFLSQEQRVQMGMRRTGEYGLLNKILSPAVFAAKLNNPSTNAENSFHGRTIANMTHRLMNYWLRSGAKSAYGIPIESRAPFLDYRVVEFCTQLPPEYLIHNGWHKHVLRKAVEEYVPSEVVWRRNKMGFPFPYREWLISSKSIAEKNIVDVNCPYISVSVLLDNYDTMVKTAPITLWRLLSVLLWWRRVVELRPIVSQ